MCKSINVCVWVSDHVKWKYLEAINMRYINEFVIVNCVKSIVVLLWPQNQIVCLWNGQSNHQSNEKITTDDDVTTHALGKLNDFENSRFFCKLFFWTVCVISSNKIKLYCWWIRNDNKQKSFLWLLAVTWVDVTNIDAYDKKWHCELQFFFLPSQHAFNLSMVRAGDKQHNLM